MRTLVSLGQTLCILAERFCIIGKYGGLSYDMKNSVYIDLCGHRKLSENRKRKIEQKRNKESVME